MEKRNYEIATSLCEPLNQYNVLFFDIETDGLSHKSKLVIIGVVHILKNSTKGTAIQYFNDDFGSEKEMLHAFVDFLRTNAIDYLVSFNGHAFDIPFLNARLSYHHIQFSINKSMNIDLLRVAKKNKALLNLTDYKLKTIESHLGIYREDVISGKDSVLMYQAYIETHSKKLKEAILLHNYEDIINMVPLIKIIDSAPFAFPPHKIINSHKWYMTSYNIKSNQLICNLSPLSRYRIEEIYFETQKIRFQYMDLSAELKIDLNLLKDSQNNTIKTIDSLMYSDQPFNTLNNEDKFMHTIQYNDHIYEEHLIRCTFLLLEHLLNIIAYEKNE